MRSKQRVFDSRRLALVLPVTIVTVLLLLAMASALAKAPVAVAHAAGVRRPAPLRVPQYALGNAILFTGNALNSVSVAMAERPLRIQYLPPLQQQSEVMQAGIAEARRNLAQVRQNALQARPDAVSDAEWADAELSAARAEAQAFAAAVNSGDMGPKYLVTLRSTGAHLRAASGFLHRLAIAYQVPQLATPHD